MAIQTRNVLFTLGGIAFGLPSLFFTYYTARLIYVNLTATAEDAAAHRTGGMLVGAVAFPLAAIIFGLISWYCFRYTPKGYKINER
ncbi:MAG: hypothetical protein ABIV21_08210 [Pyrinomonadaceae bacterium]